MILRYMAHSEFHGGFGGGRGSDRGRGQGRGGHKGRGQGKGSKGIQSDIGISATRKETHSSPSSCSKGTQSSHGSGTRVQSQGHDNRINVGSSHGLQATSDHLDYHSYDDDGEDDGEDNEVCVEGDEAVDNSMMGRGSNVANTPPTNPSHREFIERAGSGFSDPAVHRQIMLTLHMFYTKVWVTWREVDSDGIERMYNRFKSLYRWPESEDASIEEGFLYVLKENFREQMRTARKNAALKARRAGNVFSGKFDISMRDYPPTWIRQDMWHELCDVWSSAAWTRKSESGSKNRNSMVDGSKSKHSVGSITMGQHHVKLAKKNNNQQPTWDIIYNMTHLEVSLKAKLLSGEESIGSQNLKFVTPKAKRVYDTYREGLKDKYGDDPILYPIGDLELWEKSAGGKKKGQIFGVGNSNLSFVVTGTPNCGYLSSMDHAQSQQHIQNLETRIVETEARHQEELEKIRKECEESKAYNATMEKRMEEKMKELWNKHSQSGGTNN